MDESHKSIKKAVRETHPLLESMTDSRSSQAYCSILIVRHVV